VIHLEVLDDPDALAERAATRIREAATEAIRERGSFAWAISGGATPLETFRRLDLPWSLTTTFQVDERVAPAGHPDRNLTWTAASLPPGAAATLRPMPVEAAEEDLEAGAAAYAASLPERLDLAQLGLGSDGHTASLVPGDAVLDVGDRDVAMTGPYEGRRRMTMTYPALERARHVLWIVSGEAKAGALRRLLERDGSIPAARVAVEDQLVLADAAAAGWHEGQT
jgi:6-phosphogluconolactonase